MAPYPAAAIANRFLQLGGEQGVALTHMQIQKLVYFAHGWHLGLGYGRLSGETPQAFEWGPVFPALYRAAKGWGADPIAEPIRVDIPTETGGEYRMAMIAPRIPNDDEDDERARQVVDRVWQVYGDKLGAELSRISHDEGGPWYAARKKVKGNRGGDMSNDLIAKYFKRKRDANRRPA